MLLLDTSAKYLEITGLIGATTNVVTAWEETTGEETILMSDAVALSAQATLVAAPVVGSKREVIYVGVQNATGGILALSIAINNNSTSIPLFTISLDVNESLVYTHKSGWRAYASDGSIKVV